jgi:WD40 repeat protein
MSKLAFKQVAELFHRAVALAPERRPEFLEEVCAGNADLRAAVETLLRHDKDPTDIFDASPVAREASEARQIEPTLPAPHAGPAPLPQVPGYEIVRTLGRGGMGTVYLARHLALERLVALKMLSAAPATPEQLDRFRVEALALARLQHPNVVPIYDVGEFEHHPYFTMEYVAGPSLADLLDERPQDVAASSQLVEVLARAVHAVHAHGIIHRDIKPANILFQTTEHTEHTEQRQRERPPLSVCSVVFSVPKLTDFGLAKDQTAARRLTQAGVIMGTPSYMAPEQVKNRPGSVGPAADTYALGSVLYELLTGRPPFDAASPIEIIGQLINQDPLSPARLRPRLPADVVTICLKCLEKSPRRRYASAWELAEDLHRFRAGEPIKARPVGPAGRAYRWCLRRPLVAGLLALSAVLALAFVGAVIGYEIQLEQRDAELERKDRELEAALSQERATTEDRRVQIVELNTALGVRKLDEGDTFTALLRFTHALTLDGADEARARNHRTRIATALRQSPRRRRVDAHDGRLVCANPGPSGGWVAVAGDNGSLALWEAWTGRAAGPPLRTAVAAVGGSVSADGKSLATIAAGGDVRIWDLATGQSRVLPIRGPAAVRRVVFVVGGRVLATEHADFAVRLWEVTGDSAIERPAPGEGAAAFAVLSEDGRWLFRIDSGRRGQVWDLTTGKPVGPAVMLHESVAAAAISTDGRRLALAAPGGLLRVWDAAAGWMPAPIQVGSGIDLLAFSPDGAQVLSVSEGGARLWDVGTGRALTPPLRHSSPIASAACHANGRQLVTVSRDGTTCLWELPPPPQPCEPASPEELAADDGPLGVTMLGGATIRARHSAHSPDGTRLLTCGDDNTATVRDRASGEPLTPPLRPGRAIKAVFFRDAGNQAVVACEDGTALRWDLTPQGGPVEGLQNQAELLACAHLTKLQQLEPLDDRAFRAAWDKIHRRE